MAQDVPLAPPPGFEQGANLTVGEFALFNRIQTGLQGTNNIRQDPTEESDLKFIFAGAAVARSTWDKHALAFTASYVRQDALDTDNQTSEAFSATISGRYDLSDNLNISAGFLHNESIVGKNDPNQFIGNLNGSTVSEIIEGEISWKNEAYFVNLEGRFNEVNNETQLDLTVVSRIQQQDRDELGGTVQIGRNFQGGKAYLTFGGQEFSYTGSAFLLPEDRDSDGYRIGAGVEFSRGDWQGIFRVFGFEQQFDALSIGKITDVVGTAQLVWKANDKLSIAGKIQRSFDEINIETSAGLFTNLASIGGLYQIRDDLYLRAGPTYRYYQIEGVGVTADSFTFDAALAWQVHDRVELTLDVSASNQWVSSALISNLAYDEGSVTLSSVITF